jgi:ABC-type transport system involved in multi-copper enzyme maturation permease subunit
VPVVPQALGRVSAVTVREVRELARRKTPFVLRSVYALLAGIAVLAAVLLGPGGTVSGTDMAMISYGLFLFVVMAQSAFATGMGILVGVTSVQAERRNLTLGLLLLSGIRHWEVVLGKLAAQVGLSLMVFFGIIPVLALIGWGGGVDYFWLWRLVPLTLVLSVLGGSVGLAFSMWSRSGVAAAGKAILFTLLLILVPLFVHFASPAAAAWVAEYWIWSPTIAVASQGEEGRFLGPLTLVGAIALVMLAAATLGLRRAASPGTGKGLRRRMHSVETFFARINPGGIRLISRPARLEPEGNPVTWLTRVSGGLGWKGSRARFTAMNVCLSLLACVTILWSEEWGATLLTGLFCVAFVIALMAGASAFAGERARNSLSVLLAAPFPARTIVSGKLRAGLGLVTMAILPPVVVFLIPLLLIGFLGDWSILLQSELHRVLVLYCAEAVCGFFLCFGASLFLGSTLRAGIAGLALLLAVNLVPAVSHGVFWSLAENVELLPLFGLALLLAGAIASGVITLMRREVSARLAFLGRVGAVTFTGGLLNIVGSRPYNPWTTGPLWLESGTLPWFTIAYFLVAAFAVYSLVRERFDDALGRSP